MGILDKVFGNDDDKNENKNENKNVNTNASNVNKSNDRPVADFSDVQGSSSSAPVTDERTYTVKSGDSLSRIAQREYGDAAQWKQIYEANRSTISNPDLIHPGQVLTLPTIR